MKQIRIRIGANGTVQAETLGMKGKECLQYLERIEKLADATTVDSAFTEDYYRSSVELTDETIQEDTIHG